MGHVDFINLVTRASYLHKASFGWADPGPEDGLFGRKILTRDKIGSGHKKLFGWVGPVKIPA
jgi:hypothetical protein